MDLFNTDRFDCCVFFFWHWQLHFNISNGKSVASLHREPIFVFEFDFLFIRFWFQIFKTKYPFFTMLNRRLNKHKAL